MQRVWVVAWKEWLHLKRDRLTMGMMVMIPVMELLLFGYAINTDVRHMRTVVFDQDRSAASRDLLQSLQATGFYDVVGHVRGYPDIQRVFRTGAASVGVVIPPGYAADLGSGRRSATVQLVVDGSDPQTVGSATNTAMAVIQARSSDLMALRFAALGQGVALEPLKIEPAIWYNPELRTAVFVVPGLVGLILTMTMVMLTAMGITRERERGTLEQLIVSPVRSLELMVGKLLPYIIIGYVQMTLILGVGALMFDVPMVGSLWLLYALVFVFIAANLALGLFFSTLAKTQHQAMQMSFFFLLPSILLSGFMFPFEGMPQLAQVVAHLLPLTHFLHVVRGIVLKGASYTELQRDMMWLGGILVALLVLASLRFRKKLG